MISGCVVVGREGDKKGCHQRGDAAKLGLVGRGSRAQPWHLALGRWEPSLIEHRGCDLTWVAGRSLGCSVEKGSQGRKGRSQGALQEAAAVVKR